MAARAPRLAPLATLALLALLRPMGPAAGVIQAVEAPPPEGDLAVCLDAETDRPPALQERDRHAPAPEAPPALLDAPRRRIACRLDPAWARDRWSESVGHLTAVWPTDHGSAFLAVPLDGPSITLHAPQGAVGLPVLQSAELLDLPVVVDASGGCALPAPTPRAHLSGAVHGVDGGRVTVSGCGGWTTAHPDGSWFLRVDPGVCTLTAHQLDADGLPWTATVDLDLAPGDDRVVDLVLEPAGDTTGRDTGD